MKLSSEQRSVASNVLTRRYHHRVQTVGGFAGCGKTTLLPFLAKELPGFAVCALTGKAVNVLRGRGVSQAATIHSLIYLPIFAPTTNVCVGFRLREPKELTAKGFLVDEASMISKQLDLDLLSFQVPIIYIGDHGQLPPIGPDPGIMAA